MAARNQKPPAIPEYFWVFPSSSESRRPPVVYVPGADTLLVPERLAAPGGGGVVRQLLDALPLVPAEKRAPLLAVLDLMLRRRLGQEPTEGKVKIETKPAAESGFSYAFTYRPPARTRPLGPLLLDAHLAGGGGATELSLRPVARAVAGVGGVAVASPLSRAVLRKGLPATIDYEPDAVAIAGPGGRAHSHPTLAIDYMDDEGGDGR